MWVYSITARRGISGGGSIFLGARMGVGAITVLGWSCGGRVVNIVMLWGMGVCSITRCLWLCVVGIGGVVGSMGVCTVT